MSLDQRLSVQLYSARLAGDLATQLSLTAAAGFTHVEPYQDLYADLPGFQALLAEHGLKSVSGHYDLSSLEADAARQIATARALGHEIIVAPWLEPEDRPADLAGWKALAARLKALHERVTGEGLAFGWHNHDFELVPLADGTVPLAVLAEEAPIDFELDLAWIVRGEADPAEWLERLRGRVRAIHVKDLARPGEGLAEEEGWADVGTGTLPWGKLWALAEGTGVGLAVAEHDAPADYARFATRSAAAMRALGRGEIA